MSQKIANILQNIIPQDVSWKLTLLRSWQTIAGTLAEKVGIFTIEDERLVLQTSHPAWAQELNFLTPLILEKISELIGTGKIKSISFKIVKRHVAQPAQPQANNADSLHSAASKRYVMTKQEMAKLDALEDTQLKKALHDYLLRTKART